MVGILGRTNCLRHKKHQALRSFLEVEEVEKNNTLQKSFHSVQ